MDPAGSKHNVARRIVVALALSFAVVLVAPAIAAASFNVTVSSSPTVNGSFSGPNPQTFTPTASGANVNVGDIQGFLNAGTSVVIGTGSTGGTESGNITLSNQLTAASFGSLTLNAAGAIFVNQPVAVGGSFTATSTGTTSINTSSISASNQTYNGPVILGSDVTLGGGAQFMGTVDGAHSLTIPGTGFVAFGGVVGGSTPLTSITTPAGGQA